MHNSIGLLGEAREQSGSSSYVVDELRAAFNTGKTRPLEWRSHQLARLEQMFDAHVDEIAAALRHDLGKPRGDAWVAEIKSSQGHVRALRRNLKRWTAPTSVPTLLAAQPGKSFIQREPLGVVLVIAPWNFPIELVTTPLAGALAAGNTVLIKPSELAEASSSLLARLIPQYLDPECVRVVQGGVAETTELLAQRFDHIFYTGNARVGRVVMRAAAEHLTPVTLELGGKSPCIVDADCDLAVAARRITWGKFFNCGQICVAPDYLLVHERVHDALLSALKDTIGRFYGRDPLESPDYGRIINAHHHRRIVRLLNSGARVAFGGQCDEAQRYIAPTLLTDVSLDAAIMEEEIFGPLLPVIKVRDVTDAIAFVNARPKPLALYYFGADAARREAVVAHTSSGGVGVNQILFQILGSRLPFGGVGASGMGRYHGRYSIDTFSHAKSVLIRPTFIDPAFAYPPVTAGKLRWLKLVV